MVGVISLLLTLHLNLRKLDCTVMFLINDTCIYAIICIFNCMEKLVMQKIKHDDILLFYKSTGYFTTLFYYFLDVCYFYWIKLKSIWNAAEKHKKMFRKIFSYSHFWYMMRTTTTSKTLGSTGKAKKQVSWKSNPPPRPNSKKFMRDGMREKLCMSNKQFERRERVWQWKWENSFKIIMQANSQPTHSTSCGQCNTNPNFRGGCVTFHGGGGGVRVYTLFPQFHFYSSHHKHIHIYKASEFCCKRKKK